MAEIILPPEENEETPQAPELNIDKPTENSKVITIEFEAKKTNKVSTKDTNQQLYTTDTDAWFEFKETSLEGANGTYSVVFRNRHDGSIFQRTGDVVNGVAYYKIPHQEIRHAGAWRGQIVYTLSNGDTTSREFGYDVKGHILDGKDVREIVVEDFETLMSQLRSMKDNAEVELANLVNTAEQNETDRQAFFDDLVEDIDDLQANYQELIDTGVLQTNINTKLEALEEEYAPKLTEVTAQLAQTVQHQQAEDAVRTPIRFGKIKIPDDFIDVDFELYRTLDGKIKHNIDIDKRYRNKNIQRTIYTSIEDGDNLTGDGSISNPFKTPNKAFEVASNASQTRIKIEIDANEILRREFFLGEGDYFVFNNKHIVITTKDNKKIPMLNGDSTVRSSYRIDGPRNAPLPDWVKHSDNVYSVSRSNTAYVVDTNFRNPFNGNIKKMKKVSSVSECQSTPGSYYIDTSTVYVHTFDSREADDGLACIFSWTSPYRTFRLNNSTLFIENIEFFTYDGVTARGDVDSHFIFNNCDFGETSTNNSLSILHAGKTYLLECSAHDSFLDGFNYHYPNPSNRECLVFEYNSFGYNTGNEPNGTGNNVTSVHNGASVIRVDTFGEDSQGVACADVNGCYSIVFDSKMMNSKLPASNLRSSSYQFTTDSGELPAKALLINSSGASPNWSILTDEQNGTELVLESWFEGLDKIKRDVSL